MPLYMLDTSMCIYLLMRQPTEVAERFAQCRVGDVVMSAITYAELTYGVGLCADPVGEQAKLKALIEDIPVEPFGAPAGDAYGPIRVATRAARKDALDKLIAAHAVALDATLVTNNVRDFKRYPGLRVENWLSASRH